MSRFGCADGDVGLLLGIGDAEADASEVPFAGDDELLKLVSSVSRAGCVVFDVERMGVVDSDYAQRGAP